MAENSIFTILLVINTVILALLFWDKDEETGYHTVSSTHSEVEVDPKPYIIFAKGGVDVTFRNPNVDYNTYDEMLSYKQVKRKITECLPYMRYYDEPEKIENEGLMEYMPNHIPVFKEKSNMVDMKHSYKEYKKKLANDWPSYNPIAKLGYYKEKPTAEMYNDDPNQERDFKTPNMGMFNDPDYCHIHDNFILNHPEVILNKMYFFSDYHPFSIPRYFALGEYGLDTNPKVSKNMKLVNWYQRLFAMDPRTSIFYTKKAAFHTFHEIGTHFSCWGQSYNHIPGHGTFTRKDLLVTSANNYLKKW